MSSQKKDQRRADLIVPYKRQPTKAPEVDIASTMSSTLPMAAMFMRNKYMGWAALVFALQAWLNETAASKQAGKQPAIFPVGFALISLVVSYIPNPKFGPISPTSAPEATPAAAPPI